MKTAAIATMVALLVLVAEGANASGLRSVIRATGKLKADAVRFIARNTQAVALEASAGEDVRKQTPAELIERHCGSEQEGYYEELLLANGLTELPKDQPLGDLAVGLKLPTCAYVGSLERGALALVGNNGSADAVYTRLTGARADQRQLQAFFNAPLSQLRVVQPDQVLVGAHRTAPVEVVALGDRAAFESSLRVMGLRTGIEVEAGSIVPSPEEEVAAGRLASSQAACLPVTEPYDSVALMRTLEFARRRAQIKDFLSDRSEVVVIDNGFFGADPTLGADPFAGSPFESKFFKNADSGTIAMVAPIGDAKMWPINANLASVSPIAGHGTHVTGLVLGGPGFEPVRRATPDRTSAWIRISILKVSNGERTLVKDANFDLEYPLAGQQRRFVNMSLAYGDSATGDISASFHKLFKAAPNTLFLVAAGNAGRNVTDASGTYPAALGGSQRTNVMTVTAIDGSGGLAPFANFGMAVDMAAPGCGLMSWLDNVPTQTSLNGTSQATPIVTFAASLLGSLTRAASAADIKGRLVVSGTLLPAADRRKTAYRVALDLPKALLWFDDVVTARGEHAGTWIGEAIRADGIRCEGHGAQGMQLKHIGAVKRDGTGALLYESSAEAVALPCETIGIDAAVLHFKPKFRIGDRIEEVPDDLEWALPMRDVTELVMHTEFEH